MKNMKELQKEFNNDCGTAIRGHCKVHHKNTCATSCSCFEDGLQIGIRLTRDLSEKIIRITLR